MPYLFVMLGSPGSGKSYVADWLSREMQAVHFRSDDMRLAMFGEDRHELHTQARFKLPVAGAMRYVTQRVLLSGHSVIFDMNANQRRIRAELAAMAAEHAATAVTVWVQVPLELAKQRVMSRAESGGHQYFDIDFVERMAKNIEQPEGNEPVIIIDGMATAEEQIKSFKKQLHDLEKQL